MLGMNYCKINYGDRFLDPLVFFFFPAPSTGPPTSLPLGSQPCTSGSSTLSKKRAPPPPPGGHKRTLSDPPSPVLQGPQSKGGSKVGLPCANRFNVPYEINREFLYQLRFNDFPSLLP